MDPGADDYRMMKSRALPKTDWPKLSIDRLPGLQHPFSQTDCLLICLEIAGWWRLRKERIKRCAARREAAARTNVCALQSAATAVVDESSLAHVGSFLDDPACVGKVISSLGCETWANNPRENDPQRVKLTTSVQNQAPEFLK